MTPAETQRKLSDASVWPLTPVEGARTLDPEPTPGADMFAGLGVDVGVGVGVGGLPDVPFDSALAFSGLRGLPGMPEFGDRGHDWLAPSKAKADNYDPYAYDAGTVNQMRLYYELYCRPTA